MRTKRNIRHGLIIPRDCLQPKQIYITPISIEIMKNLMPTCTIDTLCTYSNLGAFSIFQSVKLYSGAPPWAMKNFPVTNELTWFRELVVIRISFPWINHWNVQIKLGWYSLPSCEKDIATISSLPNWSVESVFFLFRV